MWPLPEIRSSISSYFGVQVVFITVTLCNKDYTSFIIEFFRLIWYQLVFAEEKTELWDRRVAAYIRKKLYLLFQMSPYWILPRFTPLMYSGIVEILKRINAYWLVYSWLHVWRHYVLICRWPIRRLEQRLVTTQYSLFIMIFVLYNEIYFVMKLVRAIYWYFLVTESSRFDQIYWSIEEKLSFDITL